VWEKGQQLPRGEANLSEEEERHARATLQDGQTKSSRQVFWDAKESDRNGSKREEWSGFGPKSDQSARRVSSSTIPKGTRLTT